MRRELPSLPRHGLIFSSRENLAKILDALYLADARHTERLAAERKRLSRCPLFIVGEVGYIPFGPEAANLFLQLVSSCY